MLFDALATVGFALSVANLIWLSGLGPRAGWQLRLVRKAYKEALADHAYNVTRFPAYIPMSSKELDRLETQIKELEGEL